MRVVADRLADWAVAERNEDDADAFGRSAFNRYYYSSYLITRDMLKQLDPKWASGGHREIPNILAQALRNKAKKQIKRVEKDKLVAPGTAATLRDSLNLAVAELSNLLQMAYGIRVVADYEPETRVVRDGNRITLGEGSLGAARTWPNRAASYTKRILKIWRQLGLF
jgi:hypothetical protein